MDAIVNRRVGRDYTVIETIEAGIELLGAEVKSIREHQVRLEGAHVQIGVGQSRTLEARLVGMHAAPYLPSGNREMDPLRSRRLLLHKSEILRLSEKARATRLTTIPLKIYQKGGYIKVLIGLVRGKRKWEKREDLKKRDVKREIEREMK